MNECDDAVLPAHSTEDMGQHVHFFPSRSLYTDVWAKNEQSTNPVIHTTTPSLSHSFIFSHTHTHLGSKVSSLTMHCFFSGTCFQVAGSARSTKALAFRRPNPNLLLTMRPAPFRFQPGLLASGSNSDVHTTMCCRSLQVRSGLWCGEGKCVGLASQYHIHSQ